MRGKISIWIWNLFVNHLGNSYLISESLRIKLYKLVGMRIHRGTIRAGCIFRGKSIFIGNDVLINHNCFFDAWERIEIGNNTSIAFGTTVCTSTHKIGTQEKRAGESERRPIIIGRGCWIGANTTILPGVTIGDGCVIAAGSVVNNDLESNALYAGVPARKIKLLK